MIARRICFAQLAALGQTSDAAGDHRKAIQATDAIIRLGIAPDTDILKQLTAQFPNQVLILLAPSASDNREMLLELSERQDLMNLLWVAANNLLVEARSPAVAARLLSEVSISHTFLVHDGSA